MVTLIQKLVMIKKERFVMREIKKEEMLKVDGGSSITGSMLNAIYKTINIIYSIGESLGSYIRRAVEKKMCDI